MNRISEISNDVQNRESEAWKRLCEYVEIVAEKELEEFAPLEVLGINLFSQIYTLPESISKLTKVKKMWLYGSKLKRIPPEIGEMKSLEYFDPYTSYSLHWFPFEITRCEKLKDSRVSIRALYGNFRNRMKFPRLNHSPVKYFEQIVYCSICRDEISYEEAKQMWITLNVGTDYLPLLTNLCSENCENKLHVEKLKIPPYYLQYPHQGGSELELPKMTHMEYLKSTGQLMTLKEVQEKYGTKTNSSESSEILKVVKKIWENKNK